MLTAHHLHPDDRSAFCDLMSFVQFPHCFPVRLIERSDSSSRSSIACGRPTWYTTCSRLGSLGISQGSSAYRHSTEALTMYGPGRAMTQSPASFAASKNGSKFFHPSKSNTPGEGLCKPQKVCMIIALNPNALIRWNMSGHNAGTAIRHAEVQPTNQSNSGKAHDAQRLPTRIPAGP